MNNRAFTLIELSIVLIIIGLLVGGVLAGRQLIDSAKRQQFLGEISNLETVLKTFELKYDGLPGDLENASDYWTSCTDSGGNTCDGDGDYIMDYDTATNACCEPFRMWQHLGLAGLIEGQYDGLGDGTGSEYASLDNSYNSRAFSGALFIYRDMSQFGSNTQNLRFGAPWPDAGPNAPAFTVGQMLHFDLKLDDGLSHSGDFHARDGNGITTTCIDSDAYNMAALEETVCRGHIVDFAR